MNAPAVLDAELEPKMAEPEPMETEEALYELVNGQRVEIPPMSFRASAVAMRLGTELFKFAEASRIGEAFVEILFVIPLEEDKGRNRRPDVSFVTYDRWPRESPLDPDANAWEVSPTLRSRSPAPATRPRTSGRESSSTSAPASAVSGWSIPGCG
jgi:Uma2 family endonuclease